MKPALPRRVSNTVYEQEKFQQPRSVPRGATEYSPRPRKTVRKNDAPFASFHLLGQIFPKAACNVRRTGPSPQWRESRKQLGGDMLASAKLISNSGQIICPLSSVTGLWSPQRLALLVWLNVVAVAASVWIEQWLLLDSTAFGMRPPRWWLALGQAAALGLILTSAVQDRRAAIVNSILTGTILGYVYALSGASVIAERLAVERVDLVFQAVELGCVCCAGMAIGAAARFVGRWQLSPTDLAISETSGHAQYSVADLLFLTGVIGVTLGLINLFLEDEIREAQLWGIGATVALVVPASLPWLWGVSQNRLTPAFAVVIPLLSVGLLLFLALREYTLTFGPFAAILEHAGQRTAALAFAATINGLAIRALGFSWRRA